LGTFKVVRIRAIKKGLAGSFDFGGLTGLESLDVSENRLTALDLGRNAAHESLNACGNAPSWPLDLVRHPALKCLHASRNQFDSLYARENRLADLGVMRCPDLEYLSAWGNLLYVLDLGRSPALKELEVNDNRLAALDISRAVDHEKGNLRNNRLSALAVGQNTRLRNLDVAGNSLPLLASCMDSTTSGI
jgi:Leucine-rich repeat (LRR) protein